MLDNNEDQIENDKSKEKTENKIDKKVLNLNSVEIVEHIQKDNSQLNKITEIFNVGISLGNNKLIFNGSSESLEKIDNFLKMLKKSLFLNASRPYHAFQLVLDCYENNEFNELDKMFRYKIEVGKGKPAVYPLTINQMKYAEAIKNNILVLSLGSSACGKTFMPLAMAINMLNNRLINKIILSRPLIEASNLTMGFLPGNYMDKIAPFITPMIDCLHEMLQPKEIEDMMHKKIIEIIPVNFLRGITFKDTFVLVDEVQNLNPQQFLLILTRIGYKTKLVMSGDEKQSDCPLSYSGLNDCVMRVKNIKNVDIVKFNNNDVVRDPLVKEILKVYQQ